MSTQDQAASVGKASPGMLAILYDGSCEMCRASLDGIRQFDNSGKMEPLDLHLEEVRTQFPDLKLENLLEELHAVDESGRVYRGARAINEILRRQNGLRGLPRLPVVHPRLRVARQPPIQTHRGLAVLARRPRPAEGAAAARTQRDRILSRAKRAVIGKSGILNRAGRCIRTLTFILSLQGEETDGRLQRPKTS